MEKKNMWELQSKTIDWLRFPLIIGVVFIHNPGCHVLDSMAINWSSLNASDWYDILRILLTMTIPSISVPAFFLISGYFFFLKVNKWDKTVYREKIKKRIHTLLTPYLLWNLIAVLTPFLFHLSLGWHNSQHYADAATYWNYLTNKTTPIGWFWNNDVEKTYILDTTGPIDYPLWYLRDLMVSVVLSPIIYWLIKKLDFIYIAILLALIILIPMDGQCRPQVAIVFFSTGAYFAIRKKNILTFTRRLEIPAYILSIVFIIAWIPHFDIYDYAFFGIFSPRYLYVIVGMISVFNIASRLIEKGICKVHPKLVASVFFVYAAHTNFLINYYDEHLLNLFLNKSDMLACTIAYLTTPFVKIAMCLIIYFTLRKYAPRVLKPLMGNR